MPIVACCSNFAWELHAATIMKSFFKIEMQIINTVWLFLDMVILFQVLLYAPKAFENIQRSLVRFIVLGCLAMSYMLVRVGFEMSIASVTTAVLNNFIMSAAFIALLLSRGSSKGQSMWIAVLKCIGTVMVSIWMYYVKEFGHEDCMLIALCFSTFVLDVIYIGLLLQTRMRERRALIFQMG